MNKIAIGLAAVLMLGTASATYAEDVTAAAGAATDTAVDATTTSSIGTNFDSLLGSINAGASAGATVDFNAITDASTVTFVTVSSLQGSDPAKLDAALQSQTTAMADLHSSVSANAALNAKLTAAGYAPDDVLWIESGADGAFTVYIDDRS
jgi:hypothetical protein